MNPGQAAEIATAVALKIAPEATTAMRSLVNRMLGAKLGDDVAETVGASLSGDMAAAFRKEWIEQSSKMLGTERKVAQTTTSATAESLPGLQIVERSPQLEAASQTTSTGRGLDLYEKFLGFNRSELQGKKILDVGSGYYQQLAYDTRRFGLNAEVTSVDPRFGLPLGRDLADLGNNVTQRVIGRLYPESRTVAASAEKLPFADNTFDSTYALFSTSRYRPNIREIFSDVSEMVRVTKRGGQVRIYPIWEEHVDRFRTVGRALNLKTSFKADAPAIRPDFEAGRPAGVIDELMTIFK